MFTEGVIGDTSSNDACSDDIVLTALDAHFTACNPENRSNGESFVVCPGDENVKVKA